MTRHVLVTGAAGFVGHHLLSHILRVTDWRVTCPVSFRHRGNADRLTAAINSAPDGPERVAVRLHDLRAPFSPQLLADLSDCELVFNVASESHVDRSISDPVPFVESNVSLMLQVLEAVRKLGGVRALLQVSTDEVYGAAPRNHAHAEWEAILPSNPYSASKAAQEAIAISYWRTYGIPLVLTNTMNIFGERQDPEKFIPGAIRKILRGEPVVVHGQPGAVGSRFYLHAGNQASALVYLASRLLSGGAGVLGPERLVYRPDPDGRLIRPPRFHVVGEREVPNDEMARMIGEALGVSPVLHYEDFHATRPGHDRRYALNGAKLRNHGWLPPVSLEESLRETVKWTAANPHWLL